LNLLELAVESRTYCCSAFGLGSFAVDYQENEYMLLGMAIKYAGLRGKEVRVIGKNRSSLGEEGRIQ
jgi:hypothetical protein